jgi:protein SCO1/2
MPRRRLLGAVGAMGAMGALASCVLPARAQPRAAAPTAAAASTGGAASASTAAAASAPTAHFPFGAVRPERPIPAWKVQTHLGQATDLAALLRDRITAVQLMFTGCSAICPIQGALFAQLQHRLRQRGLPVQLLSISIDPLGDGPVALAAWLRRFDAGPGWLAVAPQVDKVQALAQLLGSGGEDPRQSDDVHSAQVFVVNRRGALFYRSPGLPSAEALADTLAQLVRQG